MEHLCSGELFPLLLPHVVLYFVGIAVEIKGLGSLGAGSAKKPGMCCRKRWCKSCFNRESKINPCRVTSPGQSCSFLEDVALAANHCLQPASGSLESKELAAPSLSVCVSGARIPSGANLHCLLHPLCSSTRFPPLSAARERSR